MKSEHENGLSTEQTTAQLVLGMASVAPCVEEACGLSPEGYRVSVLEEVPLDRGYLLNFCVRRTDGEPGRLVFGVEFKGDEVFSLPGLEQALTAALNTACGVGILDQLPER